MKIRKNGNLSNGELSLIQNNLDNFFVSKYQLKESVIVGTLLCILVILVDAFRNKKNVYDTVQYRGTPRHEIHKMKTSFNCYKQFGIFKLRYSASISSSCSKSLLAFLKRLHLEGIGSISITLSGRQNNWECDLC